MLWTVRTTDDFAYVAHLEDGVQILDIRGRTGLSQVGCYDRDSGSPTTTWAGLADVELDSTRVFSSHQTRGVITVDFGDTVAITKAEWHRKKKQLTVHATSSAQPDVSLEVVGFGPMTFKSRKNRYELKLRGVTSNPGTVEVRSSLTGSATSAVRQR